MIDTIMPFLIGLIIFLLVWKVFKIALKASILAGVIALIAVIVWMFVL